MQQAVKEDEAERSEGAERGTTLDGPGNPDSRDIRYIRYIRYPAPAPSGLLHAWESQDCSLYTNALFYPSVRAS